MEHNPPQQPFLKRASSTLVTFALLASIGLTAIPERAHASGWPTFDAANFVQNTLSAAKSIITAANTTALQLKEMVIDPAAYLSSNLVIQGMVKDTLNWALTGNNGAPTVNTDPASHMLDIGDSVANNFFDQYVSNGAVKSPNQTAIASSLREEYYKCTGAGAFFNCNQNTLAQYSANPDALLKGDLKNGGGLSGFFQLALTPQNNPLGQIKLAQEELGNRTASKQEEEKEASNGGFLPIRTGCSDSSSNSLLSLAASKFCDGPVGTPGSLVNYMVQQANGIGFARQGQVDEISEIAGSLIKNLLGGKGGLIDLNKPSAQTGRSALQSAFADAQTQANTGSAATSGQFATMVSNQRDTIVQYASDAQKLSAAATAAQAAINSGKGCQNKQDVVSIALATYPATLPGELSNVVAKHNGIIAKFTNSTDIQTLDAQQQAYTEAISATKSFSNSAAQAQEDADASVTDPPALITMLGQIANPPNSSPVGKAAYCAKIDSSAAPPGI